MSQPDNQHRISAHGRSRLGERLCVISLWSAIAVLMSAIPGLVWAKTDVEGQSDAVRITAKDASISEVLAALSAQLNLKYTFLPELDHPIEGVYSGSLQQVLARILDGYGLHCHSFGRWNRTQSF
jgi:hypothetical protein